MARVDRASLSKTSTTILITTRSGRSQWQEHTSLIPQAASSTSLSFLHHTWMVRRPPYVVFGQVIEGVDVVVAIGKVPTAPGDRPLTPVVIKTVKIERVK